MTVKSCREGKKDEDEEMTSGFSNVDIFGNFGEEFQLNNEIGS